MSQSKNKEQKEGETMSATYAVYRPGGNDTALVQGVVRDPELRKKFNDEIMKSHSNVEQVGFVNLDPANAELMMAGGEFCGNATRSTAWEALKGRPGELLIKVSGVDRKLRAGVSSTGEAWAQMPISANPEKITTLDNGMIVVEMEGITHVVVPDAYPTKSGEDLKVVARQILAELNLLETVAASGVMFVLETTRGIELRPVVWVRDIKTFFYETACGSGTTAVGLVNALRQGASVENSVRQPSGMEITIRVQYDGKKFKDAIISGPVEKVTKERSITV